MAPHPLYTSGYNDGHRDAVEEIVKWLESLDEAWIDDSGLNAVANITDYVKATWATRTSGDAQNVSKTQDK